MTDIELFVGNRRYSSWSLRAWLALRASDVSFSCTMIWLDSPSFAPTVAGLGGSRRVPALRIGERFVWDSLAICEYAADHSGSDSPLWPTDPLQRAIARSYACEMHAGFVNLRRELPMDLEASVSREPSTECWHEITRISELWRVALATHAHLGPYLFGKFSIADCMFAPVIERFRGYGVPLDALCATYVETMRAHDGMVQWRAEAAGEPSLIDP